MNSGVLKAILGGLPKPMLVTLAKDVNVCEEGSRIDLVDRLVNENETVPAIGVPLRDSLYTLVEQHDMKKVLSKRSGIGKKNLSDAFDAAADHPTAPVTASPPAVKHKKRRHHVDIAAAQDPGKNNV